MKDFIPVHVPGWKAALQTKCLKVLFLCCKHFPLRVCNQVLVLCWSWCDSVPVRKGRRHLHWEGSRCLLPSLLQPFLHRRFLSLSSRGQLCHCDWNRQGLYIINEEEDCSCMCLTLRQPWVRVLYRSQRTELLITACLCQTAPWVHLSPMLHPCFPVNTSYICCMLHEAPFAGKIPTNLVKMWHKQIISI